MESLSRTVPSVVAGARYSSSSRMETCSLLAALRDLSLKNA
jgi:hypothetical protein